MSVVDIAPHGHLYPLHYHVHFLPNLKPHPACPDKTTTNPSHATVRPQNDKSHNYTTFKTNCSDETNKMPLSNVILESIQNSPHGEFYVWLEPCTLSASNCVTFLDRSKWRLASDAYLLTVPETIKKSILKNVNNSMFDSKVLTYQSFEPTTFTPEGDRGMHLLTFLHEIQFSTIFIWTIFWYSR